MESTALPLFNINQSLSSLAVYFLRINSFLSTLNSYDIIVFFKKIGYKTKAHTGICSWGCHEQPWLKTECETPAP